MHIRQVSNAMGHLEAIKAAAASLSASVPGVDGWCLVLEDDALFSDSVAETLSQVVASVPQDADVVFLGLPSPLASKPGEVVFDDALARFELLPACDSYLIRDSAARKLADAFLPIRFATHVHLGYLFRSLGMQVRISVPNVFVDGSKLGIFTSSLDANNRLLWNQPYCQMDALLRSKAYAEDVTGTEAAHEAAWSGQSFKDSADVLALRGAHLARLGKHAEAEAVFARAFEKYSKDGCVLNNDSLFMRNYMALYRHLQPQPQP